MNFRGIVFVFLCLISAHPVDAGYVKGYYRKNGTYVAPHYRKSKGSSSTYKTTTTRSTSRTYRPTTSVKSYGDDTGGGNETSESSEIKVRGIKSQATNVNLRVTGTKKSSQSTEYALTISRMQEINNAISAYMTEGTGRPPESLQKLWRSSAKVIPTTDGWGVRFGYKIDGKSYTLSSNGPDKKQGTGDDIVSRDGSIE